MSRLLKSDFYKLSKTKSFFVCLLVCAALAVGYVFLMDFTSSVAQNIEINDPTGEATSILTSELSASAQLPFSFAANGTLFAAIVVGIFVACEFGFGTIKNSASRGFSRTKIYLSKMTVSFVLSTVLVLTYSIVNAITGTIVWGFGEVGPDYWSMLLKVAGLEILLNLAFTSVFVTIATLVRQTGAAIAINICIMQFSTFLVQMGELLLDKVFHVQVTVSNYLISTNISQIATQPLTNELAVRGLIVGVAYLAISIAVGLWAFNKRDIK